MYEHRKYVIFNVTELNKIDFNQVEETAIDTVRKSVDETKTFVKWDNEVIPSCVESLTTKSSYYTHEEMLEILSTEEWTAPISLSIK